MRSIIAVVVLVVFAAAVATSAPSETPSPTFHGILKAISNKEIILQLGDDQTVSIRRNRKTKFFIKDREVKAQEIPAGSVVAIDVKEDLDLKPVALKVTLNPGAAH